MTRFRALLLATAIVAAFLGLAATRTSPLITFTLGSTAITLGTTTTTVAGLTLTTPTLGVATVTSVNKVAITAPATSATLTITDGQTLSYVEGPWTPAISTTSTVGTPAYITDGQVGSYEKIGRQVTARFDIQLSGWTGSPTGNVTITGLPFTSTSTTNDHGYCYIGTYLVTGLAALNYGISARINTNTTVASLGQNSSTAGGIAGPVTAAQFGTTGLVQGVCNYRTN